jgi:hypothetical protein
VPDVFDPFEFIKQDRIANDPAFRAPEEALAYWTELAEQVRAELERMGFPASVVSGEMPFGAPKGAQVLVHAMYPFGVMLDWDPPLTASDAYEEAVAPAPVPHPLLVYVATSTKIISRALLDVLKEARFRVLVDYAGSQTYNYRVLAAPEHPLV